MNPALNTRWHYRFNGEESRIKVVGIWGTGSRDNYKPTTYELKHDNKQEIDLVTANKMQAMIKSGKLTLLAPGPDVPE
jgi:hypothetical protein